MKRALISVVIFLSANTMGYAQDEGHILEEVASTAKQLCEEVAQSSKKSSESLHGDISAAVSKLFRSIGNFDTKGEIDLKIEETSGVVQDQLAASLKDVRACKQHIADILFPKLFELKQQTLQKRSTAGIRVYGNLADSVFKDVGVSGFDEGVVIEGNVTSSQFLNLKIERNSDRAYEFLPRNAPILIAYKSDSMQSYRFAQDLISKLEGAGYQVYSQPIASKASIHKGSGLLLYNKKHYTLVLGEPD